MLFFRFFGFWLLQQACASPTPPGAVLKRADGAFTLKKAEAITSDRELKVSDNVLILKEVGTTSKSTKALFLKDSSTKTAPLTPVLGGGGYGVDVKLGSQTFNLLFDTGSSDLWAVQSGFTCEDMKGNPIPEGQCHFGPTFSGKFQGGKIPNENFYIQYGSGEEVAGVLGYEDVTVAGVTVKHQEIALVQEAIFVADNDISGIIGFAYSSLTSAFKGNDISQDSAANLIHYTDWIGNAVKQKKFDSLFSVVLERSGGQSQVALGGLPTISFNHDFSTTPLEIYQYSPGEDPISAKKFTYYTIETDGFRLNGRSVGGAIHAVVDTGTTLAYLPGPLAKKINAAYDPPAKMKDGLYETSCNAKPPSFAVTIGGTNFKISAEDLLPPKSSSYDPTTGLCVTGIQSSAGTPPILGGTFLKNVVAVFDIGAAKMRFAPHVNY